MDTPTPKPLQPVLLGTYKRDVTSWIEDALARIRPDRTLLYYNWKTGRFYTQNAMCPLRTGDREPWWIVTLGAEEHLIRAYITQHDRSKKPTREKIRQQFLEFEKKMNSCG